jgi:hypothetical protein
MRFLCFMFLKNKRSEGGAVGVVLYPVHLLVIPMYICTSQSLFSHSYVVNE